LSTKTSPEVRTSYQTAIISEICVIIFKEVLGRSPVVNEVLLRGELKAKFEWLQMLTPSLEN